MGVAISGPHIRLPKRCEQKNITLSLIGNEKQSILETRRNDHGLEAQTNVPDAVFQCGSNFLLFFFFIVTGKRK